MTFDWNALFELAVFVLASLITIFVVPWMKEKLGAERLKNLWELVTISVQAAEQKFGKGTGEKKKQYVVSGLQAQGVEITSQIDDMIEAAVKELT